MLFKENCLNILIHAHVGSIATLIPPLSKHGSYLCVSATNYCRASTKMDFIIYEYCEKRKKNRILNACSAKDVNKILPWGVVYEISN